MKELGRNTEEDNFRKSLLRELLLIVSFTLGGILLLILFKYWNVTRDLFYGSFLTHILIFTGFIGFGLVLHGFRRHKEFIRQNIFWNKLRNELSQSESQYRSVLNGLDVPLHVVDTNLDITLANKAFCSLVENSIPPEEIIGKNLKDLYGILSPVALNEYTTVIETGKIYQTEEKINIGGREILTETRKIPVMENNKVTRVITVIHDVTERRRTEIEKETFQRLTLKLATIHSNRELAILISREAKYLFNYDAFYFDLYDEEKKFLKNVYAEDTSPEENVSREVPCEDTYDKTDTVHKLVFGKARLTNRTGEIDPKELILEPFGYKERLSKSIMVAPLRSEARIAAVISIQSYMENRYGQAELEVFQVLVNQCDAAFNRVQAEEELRKTNLSLERKIHERTAALSKSNSMLVREISERKEVEAILKENQRKLYTMLENLPGVAYRCRYDSNWTMEYISENVLDLLGYRPTDILFNHQVKYVDLIEPEDRELVRKTIENAALNNTAFDIVYRIRTAFGDIKWVYEKGVVVRADDGTIQSVEGFIQDITREHLDTAQLKASGDHYRKLVEQVNDWLWEINPEGRYTYVSPRIEYILGYPPEEVIGKTPFDFMTREENERVSPIFKAYEAERKEFYLLENRAVHKEGYQVVLETSGTPIYNDKGEYMGYRGIDRDVTEKNRELVKVKQKELQIQKQHNALLELARENNQVIESLKSSLDKVCTIIGKAMKADRVSIWLKREDSEPPRLDADYDNNRNLYILPTAVMTESVLQSLWKYVFEKGIVAYDCLDDLKEFQKDWKDYLEEHGFVSGILVPVQLAGRINGVLCCFYRAAGHVWQSYEMDFMESVAYHVLLVEQQWKEKKDAETLKLLSEELAQQVKMFDEVLSGSPDPIGLFNTEGYIVFANSAASLQLGRTPGEMLNHNLVELGLPKEYQDEFQEQLENCREMGISIRDESLVETQFGPKWYEYILNPLHALDGTVKTVLLSARDITLRVKYENELKASNESRKELESIINRSSILFFTWQANPDFQVEYVSENIKQYKYSPEEFYEGKRSFLSILHPDDKERILVDIQRLAKDGIYSIREQFRIITSYHTERWVDGLIWLRSDAGNRLTFYQGILEDITDKKEAQDALKASEHRYRALAESAQDFIYIVDPQGRFIYANQYISQKLGIPVEQIIGSDLVTYFQTDNLQHVQESISQVLHSKTSQYISRGFNIKGNHVFLDSVLTPLLDDKGNVKSILVISRDITERKKTEEQIASLNKELEGRLNELNEANRSLDSFNSMVSHDLKGKLSVISGYLSLLKEQFGESPQGNIANHLSVIERNVGQMNEMIKDLLELSRFSKKEMDYKKVDLNQIVTSLVAEQKETEKNRQIEYKLNNMPPAYGDELLISEALMNLLSNAIKFTRIREKAEIEIGGWEGNSQSVYFIKDNGIGFDMKYADRLFTVFQRLHKASDFEGTGVGLTIVQKIINRHGGSIWFEARPDHGATFFFTLPSVNGNTVSEAKMSPNL
jgi:PAS domain S-box-containing protein